MRTAPTGPAGLPLLGAGLHLSPEDGACLMEYASVLAGERFSDSPRCTDPTLATLARLVNDSTTDGGRQRLAGLAPRLAAAGPTDAVAEAALVLEVVRRVHRAVGGSPRLDRDLGRARRRLHRRTTSPRAGLRTRALDLAHRRGAARHRLSDAVGATAALPSAVRDVVLYDVLAAGLDRVRATAPQREPSPFTAHL
jgi:hypothetical protein